MERRGKCKIYLDIRPTELDSVFICTILVCKFTTAKKRICSCHLTRYFEALEFLGFNLLQARSNNTIHWTNMGQYGGKFEIADCTYAERGKLEPRFLGPFGSMECHAA